MRLFVTEKPSVARDLARALGVSDRGDGTAIRGRDVWITWCLGHLVEIAEPHEHDPQWKRWSAATLPILPEALKLRPIGRTKAHLSAVSALLRAREVDEVINACDAGREGELIFRYVYEHSRCRQPVQRLWLSSLTPAAIRTGLARLRPGRELDPLGAAARCRAEADWLVGMNGTRAYTLRADGLLSLGRVQTPTLALVVAREEAIERFVPTTYWTVRAELEAPDPARPPGPAGSRGAEPLRWEARYRDRAQREDGPASSAKAKDEGGREGARGERTSSNNPRGESSPSDGKDGAPQAERLPSAAAAAAIVAAIRAQPGRVLSVTQREERVPPPLLHHLTSLQQEANRRFGLTAERTLSAAQALYERHKLLTYPRTDSRHLTRDVAAGVGEVVESLRGAYGSVVDPLLAHASARGLPSLSRRFVDDAQVGDHHALIPTGKTPDLAALGRDEARVFDLVARRFLAAFHPPARYAKSRIDAEVATHLLRAEGRVQLDPGWERAEPPQRARGERLLPAVAQGPCRCTGAQSEEGQTRPPHRYSEATLLGAMERAGRAVEREERGSGPEVDPSSDDATSDRAGSRALQGGVGERELIAALRDQGLGTPATRAATIETLLTRTYLVRDGRNLIPGAAGRALIDGIPDGPAEALKSARLTGLWEARLSRIARGEADPARFRRDLRAFVADLVGCLGAAPRVSLPEGARSSGGRSGGRGGARQGPGSRARRASPSGAEGARGGSRTRASGARARGTRARREPARRGRAGASGARATPPRERDAGATPRERDAGATPRERDAGATPRERDAGTTPRERDAGATPRERDAGATPPGSAPRGPRCRVCREGRIIRGQRGWGCDRYREGCHLVVWFQHQGIEIPPEEADRLFRSGKTRLFALHPNSGRKARLVLTPGSEGNVAWEETRR